MKKNDQTEEKMEQVLLLRKSGSFSIAESSASGISSALTVPITLPTTCT